VRAHQIIQRRRPRFPEGDLIPWRGLAFVGITIGATLAVSAVAAADFHPSKEDWLVFAGLAALAALTDVFTVRGPRNTIYDTAALFLVAAAVILPFEFAPFVAIPACLVDAARRRCSPVSLLHNIAAAGLATSAASVIAHAVSASAAGHAAVLAAAAVAYAVTIPTLDGLYGHLAHEDPLGLPPGEEVGAEFVLGSLGVALAGLHAADPWLMPFVLTPLVLIHRSQRLPALEDEAVRDPKTGLLNARRFDSELDAALTRAHAAGRPLSLLALDLDYLREINNVHGHLAGDAVINGIADLIKRHLRASDIAGRFGGEEFLVALPGVEADDAARLGERLRGAVASTVFADDEPEFRTRATVSVGVASFPRDGQTRRELIHAADRGLLAAKARGRNAVVEAASLAAGPAAPVFEPLVEQALSS
jgi:diguanylate cyclase (GGDEF)-like protein